jgi:tetrahydromethanopterin S-methyltransferase subunit A
MTAAGEKESAFKIVSTQLAEAIAAPKCHKCGCLHKTVEALSGTDAGKNELAPILGEARSVFVPKQYDCLGCPVCYPAIAADAFVEAYPDVGAGLDLCPTEEPDARPGWPPLPGDFYVLRYGAPVAVCTLNSEALAVILAHRKPEGLAIVGTMHTENLGIERLIKNVLANPHIRFLLLCGEDTQQAVGHLPGQSLECLFRTGLDDRGRIIGAHGKRPVLRNVSREEVHAFLNQVELVSFIGEQDEDVLIKLVRTGSERNPGLYAHAFVETAVKRIHAKNPTSLTLDKAGYFVIYPDWRSKSLVVEHYTNQGVLDCMMEGSSTGALYAEAIERNLVTRLDHAAYLGRELARAEQSLLQEAPSFVQDAAPGALLALPPKSSSETGSACGCSDTEEGSCQ